MTGDIPTAAALAPVLVANAGARPEDSELLAGLLVDAAQQAASLGAPKPMVEHIAAARVAFPMMFTSPKPTPTASASTPPKSITERLSKGETLSFDEVHDAIMRLRRSNQG